PSCPALFRYEQLHGRAPKKEFDLGHAAHALVLGAGPELVLVDASDWRTTKAKGAAAEARERGAVPLLPDDYQMVHEMAKALMQHPVARVLFDPDHGLPEQTLVWRDEPSGVWRRALLDWLPDPDGPGRLIIPDYKTTKCAAPEKLPCSIHPYGYHQQSAWYQDGAAALGLSDDVAFVFVFQEKAPPYLVTVVELDALAVRIGRDLNRRAIDLYAECVRHDTWPGYSDEVESVALPVWVERAYERGEL
ncbi:MAG: PD-(D/E)XK nuclease-like domain-containing protein, partial [Actinocrinis sp.]